MAAKAVAKLNEQDLNEFRRRRAALESCAMQFQMAKESYSAWTDRIKKRYKMKGLFDVDPTSGQLVRRKNNGRSD